MPECISLGGINTIFGCDKRGSNAVEKWMNNVVNKRKIIGTTFDRMRFRVCFLQTIESECICLYHQRDNWKLLHFAAACSPLFFPLLTHMYADELIPFVWTRGATSIWYVICEKHFAFSLDSNGRENAIYWVVVIHECCLLSKYRRWSFPHIYSFSFSHWPTTVPRLV